MSTRPRVCLVAVSAPGHYALWNALSVETIAGDIRGCFGPHVDVSVSRIRAEGDVEGVAALVCAEADIVGISAEIGSLTLVRSLLRSMKSSVCDARDLKVVFGNTLPTYLPEVFKELWPDAEVVRGEGEDAFRSIVAARLQPQNPEAALASCESTCMNLDHLVYPPSFDTLDEVLRVGGSALMETSRGCSWSRCSYCSIDSYRPDRGWQPLPLDRVEQNLRGLITRGITDIEMTDPDFLGGRSDAHIDRARQVADVIERVSREEKVSISFRAFLTPRVIVSLSDTEGNRRVVDVLERLKDVGLSKVYLGLESGSRGQLRRYSKGSTIAVHAMVLETLVSELGLEVDSGFLMFDPDLALEEVLENIQFFRENNLIRCNQWPFRPVRVVMGTPLCEELRRQGRLGPLDQNMLCYEYKFGDARVQAVFDLVDELSAETRLLFSAVKVISRLQVSSASRGEAARFAQEMVEENGEVYLDLLESLVLAQESHSAVVDRARRAVARLVSRIRYEVQTGVLSAHSNHLLPLLQQAADLVDV